MVTTTESYRLTEIQHFRKSVEDLLREGVFPDNGVTLLEVRQDYFAPDSSVRADVHEDYGRGERFADVVETDGAQELSGGRTRVVYVKRPENISLSLRSDRYSVEGGKRIHYDCPADGWGVPADGVLFHPETGAALDTRADITESVRLNADYIAKHWDSFKDWRIPERFHEEFQGLPRGFNPRSPTPEQIAEFITSYQRAPVKNSGVRAVRRDFWGRCYGPFYVRLDDDLRYRYVDVGARLRRKIA